MGNKAATIVPDEIKIKLKLDKTQFEVGEDIAGTICVDILALQLNCQIDISVFIKVTQIVGKENATYCWNESNQKYQYIVQPNKFYRNKYEVASNLRLFSDCYSFPFKIKNEIQQPSFLFSKGLLQCSIEYFIKVKVRFGEENKLTRSITDQQNISIYSSSQCLNELQSQLVPNKRDVIVSYGCCLKQKLQSLYLLNFQPIKYYYKAKMNFSLQSQSIIDFLIKRLSQQIQFFVQNLLSKLNGKPCQNMSYKKKVYPQYNQVRKQKTSYLILQSPQEMESLLRVLVKKLERGMSSQYNQTSTIVMLLYMKELTGMQDVDILLPLIVNAEKEVPPEQDNFTESRQQQKEVHMDLRQNGKPILKFMNKDELNSDENRIAQKLQFIYK